MRRGDQALRQGAAEVPGQREVDAIDIFRQTDLVPEPTKKKILDQNPRRLYALE